MAPPGMVGPRGTAVRLTLGNGLSPPLDAGYLEAGPAFDRAIPLNSSNASVQNNRGNTWLALVEYQAGRGEPIDDAAARALSSYRGALDVRPDYTLAFINIAETERLMALDRVRRGKDPSEILRDARAALDRYDAANKGDVDALVLRARCAVLEARWELAGGRDPRPALANARQAARDALAIDGGAVAAMLVEAQGAQWEAEWLSRRGSRTNAALRPGYDAIARAKAAEPHNAEALALEAALLFIDARDRYPESATELRRRAAMLVDQALRAKPSLRPDYGALR